MKFIGIIPARYASSRYPGKPLCEICGKPMIQWVYDSIMKWDKWEGVYLATDSVEIETVCRNLAIPVIMTRDTHTDCLDRAGEVIEILEAQNKAGDRYIVIQGDEPLFDVCTLDVDLTPEIVNFYTKVQDVHDLYNPDSVKVVVTAASKALYFSRYTIPYHEDKTRRTQEPLQVFKQIGVYSFSGEQLKRYCSLRSAYLENLEGIGLLRLLENDIDVTMRYTEHDSISVDTPADRNKIEELLRNT